MPLDVEQLLQRLESSGFEKEASTLHVLFSSAAAAARSRPASPQDEQLPARLGPFEVIGERLEARHVGTAQRSANQELGKSRAPESLTHCRKGGSADAADDAGHQINSP